LCRPGRLDTLIYVPLPDEASRVSILKAQLRNTPVADDIDLRYIATKTHGFSGADLGYITQRAVKLAIKESISAELERGKDGDTEMTDEVVLEDPVPELTKRHFEEAMSMARRSVSDVEVRRYEAFAQQMKQTGGLNSFRFPTEEEVRAGGGDAAAFGDGGNDDSLYE